VPNFLASGPIALGVWHKLAVEVNFSSRTFQFFVDNVPFAGPFAFPSDVNTTILQRGSVVAYTAPDTKEFEKSAFAAHYDNFSIH
jgi:hypothetical protein